MSNHSVLILALNLLKYCFSFTCVFCPTCVKGAALYYVFFPESQKALNFIWQDCLFVWFVFMFPFSASDHSFGQVFLLRTIL